MNGCINNPIKLNIMEVIADKYGLKLDELFKVVTASGADLYPEYVYKITSKGFWRKHKNCQETWYLDEAVFTGLCTGRYAIMPVASVPKNGSTYFSVYIPGKRSDSSTREPIVYKYTWRGSSTDIIKYIAGNMFLTKEDAEANIRRLKVRLEELATKEANRKVRNRNTDNSVSTTDNSCELDWFGEERE